jgi:hypothetical protein
MQDFRDTLPQAMFDLADHPGDDDRRDLPPSAPVRWLERAAHAWAGRRGAAPAPQRHDAPR